MKTTVLPEPLVTPYLLLDKDRFLRNIDRLYSRIQALGCAVRPHLKTLRSLDAGTYLLENRRSPATVSTLAEAEAFASAGYHNLLYAVGISPNKLARIAALRQRGTDIHLLLDSAEQARAIVGYAQQHSVTFSAFIEIDCDGHRGGIRADAPQLTEIAHFLHHNGVAVSGVMTHAGESYHARSWDEIAAAAEQECAAATAAAARLRQRGIPCPVVSVGSTPTAHAVSSLAGVTEVRAGVFSTFDLFMSNVGVCSTEDIALSVVTSVIGHNHEKGWVFVDAGWMALSRDRGTATQRNDYGYGLVCGSQGTPLDLTIASASQEHGIIVIPPDSAWQTTDFPTGTTLRILPNHACATAAMHHHYQVISAQENSAEVWERITGW